MLLLVTLLIVAWKSLKRYFVRPQPGDSKRGKPHSWPNQINEVTQARDTEGSSKEGLDRTRWGGVTAEGEPQRGKQGNKVISLVSGFPRPPLACVSDEATPTHSHFLCQQWAELYLSLTGDTTRYFCHVCATPYAIQRNPQMQPFLKHYYRYAIQISWILHKPTRLRVVLLPQCLPYSHPVLVLPHSVYRVINCTTV